MARNQDADWQAMKFSAWAHSSAPTAIPHSLSQQARQSEVGQSEASVASLMS